MLIEWGLIAAGGISLAATLMPNRTTHAGQLREVFENTGLAIKKNGRLLMPCVIKVIKTRSGHHLIVKLPPGVCPTDIRQRQEEIESALGAEVEITDNGNGIVHIHSYENEIPMPGRNAFNLDPAKFIENYPDMVLPIPLGYSRAGLEVRDLSEFPHLLIAGETYGGKSNLMHQILITLTYNPCVRLFAIDMARVELSYLKNHAYFACNIEQAIKVLEYLHKEMFRRMKVLDKAGVVKIQEYQGDDMPYLVLALEEISQLAPVLAKDDKEKKKKREYAHSLLIDIICLARKVGIHVIVTTQRPDRDILPGQLKANIPATVCFKVRNRTNSEICLDNDKADKLPRIKGRAIFQFDCERVIQTMHLPIDKARSLLPYPPMTKPVLPQPKKENTPPKPKVEPY